MSTQKNRGNVFKACINTTFSQQSLIIEKQELDLSNDKLFFGH